MWRFTVNKSRLAFFLPAIIGIAFIAVIAISGLLIVATNPPSGPTVECVR